MSEDHDDERVYDDEVLVLGPYPEEDKPTPELYEGRTIEQWAVEATLWNARYLELTKAAQQFIGRWKDEKASKG